MKNQRTDTKPFPLSDIQEAYWVGRSNIVALGGVTTHLYCEFDCRNIDLDRLQSGWRRLVERHDNLRSSITPDGQQCVCAAPPDHGIQTLDLRGESSDVVDAQLVARRNRFSHEVRGADKCPAMRVYATRIDDHRLRLHLSTDVLFVDARSRALLFDEWRRLYQGEDALPELQASFRDFIGEKQKQYQGTAYQVARDYWLSRIDSLPDAPDLPLAAKPESIDRPRFERYGSRLEPDVWSRLRQHAESKSLRPTVVILAAFTEVLRAWSRAGSFTVNLTLFDKLAKEARFRNVVGDFTSSLLLAVEPAEDRTLEARIRRLQGDLLESLKHSAMSGVDAIRELRRRRSGDRAVLMPVVFTSFLSMDAVLHESFLPTWLGDPVYEITQTPQVWLDMQVRSQGGTVHLAWDFVKGLFPDGMTADMFEAMVRLLRALADDEAAWSGLWPNTLRYLTPATQTEQRAAYNATQAPFMPRGLHEPFFEQAARRPDHPAIITPGAQYTYSELQARAVGLAQVLKRRRLSTENLIAVVMRKGWEQVAAVLGVLASRAAYLPIDPDLPPERIMMLLEEGKVEIVLTQSGLDEVIDWPGNISRICVDRIAPFPASAFTPPREDGSGLAYVIYTSGTTGRPKGVMIEHASALNTVVDVNKRFGIGPDDRVLALSSLSFDLSVFDVFGTLAAGGTIVMPSAEKHNEPVHWAELIRSHRVTVWNSVPTLMQLLVEYWKHERELGSPPLRLVLLSGDWIPVALPGQIRMVFPQADVISLGGATEASIWSICFPIDNVDPSWSRIPYGRPLANQCFHVLNAVLAPCQEWVVGQLYIGGRGVARGYWEDPALTTERFVTHPETGKRLYRTGDTGRFLPGGDIEFLGREDSQVKVQGYRIETGEVESKLAGHPAVEACVVTAHGSVETGRRLIAHIVCGKPAPKPEELREFLCARLPAYMIPVRFRRIDALPTGITGKVDRAALQAVDPDDVQPREYRQVDSTGRIRRLIEQVGGVHGIEPGENLLALGLTSVDIIRVVNRVQTEFGVQVPVSEFYRHPTVEFLEDRVTSWGDTGEPSNSAGSAQPNKKVPARPKLLLDPAEREAFKNSRPGIRRFKPGTRTVRLRSTPAGDGGRLYCTVRRSYRQFASSPVTKDALDSMLELLRPVPFSGGPKRRYGSAGGLYPVQTYLCVRDGHVQELAAGAYYYDPEGHRLVVLNDNECLDASAYDPFVNAPLFEASAFALFLIADLDAIVPLYGGRSVHYATIEAGLICQLLEAEAPAFGVGLCQVGDVNDETVHRALLLEDRHVLIHSLLGGTIEGKGDWTSYTEAYSAAREWSCIVPLQTSGSAPPFFCVHPQGGGVLCLSDLARHMAPDFPFFGLQSRGLLPGIPPQHSIHEMAVHYMAEIRRKQPQGPYRIGGSCMGGMVAFEIALLLNAAGESVDKLVLIDTRNPKPRRVSLLSWRMAQYCRRAARNVLPLWVRRGARWPAAKGGASVFERVNRANVRARRCYVPGGVYQGVIDFIWAESTDEPLRSLHDPHNGWQQLTSGILRPHPVPCHHDTMLEEPAVLLVAEALRRILDEN